MYSLVKIGARIALYIFCGKVEVRNAINVPPTAPLLLAANHPNSFFDAIVLGARMPRPLHFLARGDAFKKKPVAFFLRIMHLIPVYRLSEGKENLVKNEDSFDACIEVLKKGGAVLIFPEGICENEWNLRPLKKGTARLAYKAWEHAKIKDMQVLPVGMNYNSFRTAPKWIWVEIGQGLGRSDFETSNEARFNREFSSALHKGLAPLVMHRQEPNDIVVTRKNLPIMLLGLIALPTLIGFILHRPLYVFIRGFVWKKTQDSVFYDSVLFGLLFFIYPSLVFLLTLATVMLTGSLLSLLIIPLLPFTAWCYKLWHIGA